MSELLPSVADGKTPLFYSVVIRAHQITPLVINVIDSIKKQTIPPFEIIIVDSSNNSKISDKFRDFDCKVVIYPDEEFNYSKAINLGVESASSPYTCILSSHVVIHDISLLQCGWKNMINRNIEIGYWCYPPPKSQDFEIIEIDKRNFTGQNGLSNSLALAPTNLLRNRPFREEVFSAEDQEWTDYYFKTFNRSILRIVTKDISYLNPMHGASSWSELKLFNEELAIGHFVNRRLIMPDRILLRFLRGVLAAIRLRPNRAKMHFSFAAAMVMANFRRPKRQSRYF